MTANGLSKVLLGTRVLTTETEFRCMPPRRNPVDLVAISDVAWIIIDEKGVRGL